MQTKQILSNLVGRIINYPQNNLQCLYIVLGLPGGTSGKEPACQLRGHKRCGFDPWVRKIPWKRAWQPTPVLLPGESHGQGSLAGYSLQGCKELDTTGVTQHAYTHTVNSRYVLLVKKKKFLRSVVLKSSMNFLVISYTEYFHGWPTPHSLLIPL